jgi:hypothetical protein
LAALLVVALLGIDRHSDQCQNLTIVAARGRR